MEDRRNWGKYHTLTEEEIQEEIRRSQEVRKNMLTMTGKMKNGKIVNKSHRSVTATTPQFGVTTKSRRIEQRAWEKEMNTAALTGKTVGDSRFGDTMDQLLANTHPQQEEEEEEESSPIYNYEDVDQRGSIEQKAFSVIQKKYEQNLTVVEKLYQEKLSLEDYTKTLERQLEALTGKKIEDSPIKAHREELFPSLGDQDLPPSYEELERSSSHPPKRSNFDPLDRKSVV